MSFLDSEDAAGNGNGEEENGEEENGGEENVVNYSPASTCIARLTYHRDTSDLFVTFTDGRNYVIPSFPEIELERWVNSPSVGGYFNNFVRGNY